MLRENNIVCGTTTTGTGTLTLAACPAAIGGIDPYVAFGGLGLGTSNPTATAYTLIEYTDNSYATIKQREQGMGYILLGASIGATTLARTKPTQTQVIATPASTRGTIQAPVTGITIGTAANTLVFIGPAVDDVVPGLRGYTTAGASDGFGSGPAIMVNSSTLFPNTLASGYATYSLMRFDYPDFIKSVSYRTSTVLTSPTTQSLAMALYTLRPDNFLPDRLLVNFGTSTTALRTSGNLTMTAANGAFVTPGYYALAHLPIWTGGSGQYSVNFCPPCYASPWGSSLNNYLANIASLIMTSVSTLVDQPSGTWLAIGDLSLVLSAIFRNT